jgi:MFS family permease
MTPTQKVVQLYFNPIRRSLSNIFYGWWIVASSFLMFSICGGIAYYGLTAFFNPIANEFNWSAAAVSFAFSLRSVEAGFLSPLIGFFIDKFGARKIVLFGILLNGLGYLLMSHTHSLLFFYGSFVLLSIGTSCGVGMAQYVTVANWFSKKRTLAMGITASGYGVSGFIGPILVWLIAQNGWRSALVIVAIVVWLVGIPLGLVLRHKPESYGYLPDGEKRPASSVSRDAHAEPVHSIKVAADVSQERDLTVRQALATSTFWLLILFGSFTGLAPSAIISLEMPYLTSVGISRQIAGWAILGMTGLSLVGRLGFGVLGDRYDKRRLLAIGAALQFAGVLVFAMVTSPWMIVPFVLLYGPGWASQIPIWPSIRAEYFGLKHFATIGGLQGLGFTISGIVAPLLAGWVFDVWGTYRPIWLAYAVATAIGIPFVLLIRKKRR